MKKLYFVLVAFLYYFSSPAQNITGTWNSILEANNIKLRIVFHINEVSKDSLVATMDSPDQGAKNLPATSCVFTNNQLTIKMDQFRIVFSGNYDATLNQISGTFTQAGHSLALTFTRNEQTIETKPNPTEPQPPYPYNSENVFFKNKKDNVTLAGTLTYPKTGNHFPVAVLVTGSGPQNRDEELLGHKPFLVLSDYLTRRGYAVLRYDDRGCFQSTGNFATATTIDFAEDANAAVEYLKTRKEINPQKIGIIGHSEGGLIAPIVAVRNPAVNYIVLMAGPGEKGSQILLSQQSLIAKANGVSDDLIKQQTAVNAHIFNLADSISDTDSLKKSLKNYLYNEIKHNSLLQTQAGDNISQFIDTQIQQITSPWMLTFLRFDPQPTLEKVRCKVLAIAGSKDLQVDPVINLNSIRNALTKGGNKQFSIKEINDLNHLFQECTTGSPNEYAGITQTISPMALETIFNWLK